MSERIRVPIADTRPISAGGDVTATLSLPDAADARRFSLTVTDAALQRMGAQVIPHLVERLTGQIAYEQRGAVEATVAEYLRNREWAEPIIREAIREAVHQYIGSIFALSRA